MNKQCGMTDIKFIFLNIKKIFMKLYLRKMKTIY